MDKKLRINKKKLDQSDSLDLNKKVSNVSNKKVIQIGNSSTPKLSSKSTTKVDKSLSISKSTVSSTSKTASKLSQNIISKPETISKNSRSKLLLKDRNKIEIKSFSSVNKKLETTNNQRPKRVDETMSKFGVKSNFTNVTVRSPPSEHRVKNILKNDIEIENLSRNHNRHKTRTLEPDEVKVLKVEATNRNMESSFQATRSNKQHFIKPEAFYVPLEEKFVKAEIKNKHLEPDSDSNSYEEDFESYESDFESFASSGHKDSDGDRSSIHDISEDDQLKSNKIPNISNISDETHFDSGNYDLKIIDMKMKPENQNIHFGFLKTENVDIGKMPSYSDEGFEENSGGFSSTSATKFDDIENILNNQEDKVDLDVLLHVRKYKTRLNYYQQRALDLSNLITFDNIEYSLFEISPIPYDIFIKTYGKSNVIQRSSQTNDEYIDDSTQTDLIVKQHKWCQFPVNYSKFQIITKGLHKPIKRILSDYSFQNPISIENDSSENSVIEIKSVGNPLEIFRSQRSGCGINYDIPTQNKSFKLNEDHMQYKKLYDFVGKTGKFMLNYLKETSSVLSITKNFKSEYSFSNTFTLPLKNVMNKMEYLQDRPVSLVGYCSNNVDLLLTVHPKSLKNLVQQEFCENLIYQRTILCLWECSVIELSEPTMVLLSPDNVSICKIQDGLNGYVIAGTRDGMICSWDLDEHEMWHNLFSITQNQVGEKNAENCVRKLVLRTCSFSENLNEDGAYYGPIVDISIGLFQKLSEELQEKSYNQVLVLQEFGLLTIWTVIRSKSSIDFSSPNSWMQANQSSSSSYWSNIKFIKHLVVNVKESLNHLTILNNGELERNIEKKRLSYQEFPLTNVKRKNSYKRAITPRSCNDLDIGEHIPLKVTNSDLLMNTWDLNFKCLSFKIVEVNCKYHFLIACSSGWIVHYEQRGNLQHPQVFMTSGSTSLTCSMAICNHNLPYFLVGCDTCIDLFALSSPKPMKSFFYENKIEHNNIGRPVREEIICVEWSKLRPCLFFTLSNMSHLTVWDLLKSDMVPIISEVLSRGKDNVVSTKLLLDEKQTPKKEYLILYYASGLIEKYELSNDLTTSMHRYEVEVLVLEKYLHLL